MAELVMRCNDLQCRAELTDKAVVTTCSHIFCLRCAKDSGLFRQSREERQCPACGSELIKDDDCVATALNPSEDYKSSVLSGMSPSIIMECATRALAFYSYQAMNAVMYQEHLANSLTNKYKTNTGQLEQKIHEVSNELAQLRESTHSYRKSYISLESRFGELSEAFKEKSKALAETQGKYQQLKTQAMMAEVQYAASEDAENALHMPNSFSAPTRVVNMPRRTVSLPGATYSRQGPTRLPTTTTQTGRLRVDRTSQAHHSQNRMAPSRLSSYSSNDRFPLDQGRRYSQMQSAQKTRLPIPVGMSAGSQSQNNIPPRAAGYGYENSNIHHQRPTNIALPGPSKRSRTSGIRTNGFV